MVFFETDCPTCRLTLPYLKKLPNVTAISQDVLTQEMSLPFEVIVDRDLSLSRKYDPETVPAVYLLDAQDRVVRSFVGFDKADLNKLAAAMGVPPIADAHDGNPASKPGCMSRHREGYTQAAEVQAQAAPTMRASRITVDDPYAHFADDPLPVVPPTVERVERMLAATPLPPEEVVALIPPNYGAATVEKIAANAVMAGCRPEMMRVLIPLIRAAADERFNLHGVQATTHFAAPLIIVNGPVRRELGFACGSNVFSNVARANSSLGRAFQLILTNLGGARPGEIDMSALGNPGKFSYCIAENEEESPWPPLVPHSAVTLFAGEAPHGVSEHQAREGRVVLKAITRALATVWSYRACNAFEAVVVLCPEHVKTVARDGFTKESARDFLFENTGIPHRHYDDGHGEGVALVGTYQTVTIDGEPCYRKFAKPESIKIVVAGGTAGKFSAVIGSWATGPRGSQMVTYPIP